MRRAPYALTFTAVMTATTMLLATPAFAAGDCPLLTDAAGDARFFGVAPGSDRFDILSADVASGPTSVSVALRVLSLAVDPVFGDGEWLVGWTVGDDADYMVSAQRPGGAGTPYVGTVHTPTGAAPVRLTVETPGTFTWTVPRSAIPELAEPGRAEFANLRAITAYLSSLQDVALAPGVVYVDRRPGCIPAS
jgi:hypothetical protein